MADINAVAEQRSQDPHIYRADPPPAPKLRKAWQLLEQYSHVPASEIEGHVRDVRDRAWAVFPYNCIGRWRFLDLYITTLPQYPELLRRLTHENETLLDVGCCFGQALRQLSHDGAPQQSLVGSDLRKEFIDLGYELFRDRDTFKGRFVAGNMLDPDDASVKGLDGTVDMIHAASFFHLFGWDDQVKVGQRMVRFFKGEARAMIVGRQAGTHEAGGFAREEGKRYIHSQQSMRRLWDEIGNRTGTKWVVEAELNDSLNDIDDLHNDGREGEGEGKETGEDKEREGRGEGGGRAAERGEHEERKRGMTIRFCIRKVIG
ncbi:hypothetical protein QBC46DRAFT_453995 [Diplogelasinospora grovesii]|uniref:Methyltransferase domain-containing protein n=1 Tax=Diplogelasinospora grovesii TaxID=303347 RepID=A0AAN6MYB0_9PEZI|nr:hypothetical protein QBC46DRAFT_453995 [Diplogelasinospora grovesii]